MSANLVVRNEEDAWHILSLWLDKKEAILAVAFEGWPQLDISISGEDYNASLNTGQMSAFVDFKLVMERTYAAIAHGAYDARRLRSHEEEQLEFTTRVKKGSSITETDFTALISAFSQIVVTHQNISLAAAIVLGLLFVSRPLIRQHLENRAKQIDSEERKKLIELAAGTTPEDRERERLMNRAVTRICQVYPQFAQVLPDASAAHWRLTSSAANADKMTIAGVELSKEQLEVLAERRSFRDVEIKFVEDSFQVLGVVRVHEAYRVQLKSEDMHISAIYKAPEMTDAKARRLVGCITSLQLIHATIELKTIEKAHVLGRLMTFKPIPNSFGEAQKS